MRMLHGEHKLLASNLMTDCSEFHFKNFDDCVGRRIKISCLLLADSPVLAFGRLQL